MFSPILLQFDCFDDGASVMLVQKVIKSKKSSLNQLYFVSFAVLSTPGSSL